MARSNKNKGHRRTVVFLFLLVVVSAACLIAYRYRGSIRLKLINVLLSFDDTPQDTDSLTWMDHDLPGLWMPARDIGQESALTPEQQRIVNNIESLAYLSGYQEAPYLQGVVHNNPEEAFQGYNLVLSGHSSGVTLIDMEGNEVHEWYAPEVSLYEIWPEAQNQNVPMDFWRRAHLDENGDLTFILEHGGIVRVDKDSNVLWTSEFNGAHHDLYISESTGYIYTIGRNIHINPRYNTVEPLVEDYICILDSLGNEIATIPILDAIENSQYVPVLRQMPPSGDVLHCNSIELIEEGQLPEGYEGPLRENTLILSFRTISLVCAMDIEENSIYWAESDLWFTQHDPTVLENGNLLVFDNNGYDGRSTVLEFSPRTDEVVWFYRGTEENPFYSRGIGSCQRLPNGNTFITESTSGRAFEVTPEKEIVWDFYNPHLAGHNNELIAILFDVVRIPEEYTMSWLDD